jgi:hypothetical protein
MSLIPNDQLESMLAEAKRLRADGSLNVDAQMAYLDLEVALLKVQIVQIKASST